MIAINPDGIIVTWNRGAEKIFQYQSQESIGRSLNVISSPDHPSEVRDLIDRVTTLGPIENMETERKRKDGTMVSVEMTMSPIRSSGGVIEGVGVVFRDITEKRLYERLIVKGRRSETMGLLVAGISHEINNTLCGILGMAEVIRRGLDRGDEADMIIEEAEKAGTIVRGLLSHSSAEPGIPQDIELPPLIHRALRLVENELRIRNITTLLHCPESIPSVRANSVELEQLLLNLALTARAAGPSGGSLDIFLKPEKDFVRIDVMGPGVWISPDDRENGCEPSVSMDKGELGAGLEWSVVRRMLQRYGGTIEAARHPEGGGIVTIRLPVSSACAAQTFVNADSFTGPTGLEILLVEDDAGVLEVCRRQFEHLGNRVVPATNMESALDLIRDRAFDVVICDYVLAGKNGVSFYQALKEGRRKEAERFIMITGLSGDDIDAEVEIVYKPFTFARLREAVLEIIHPPHS